MRAESLASIPELVAIEKRVHLVRIAGEQDVPVTRRILRLIDAAPFRRLARIRQLGLVSLVYPGAVHSRFEHSLGVYRNALLFARRLMHDEEFAQLVTVRDLERLLVAALLHDIGHWPYCHAMEDLGLDSIPRHESAQRIAAVGGSLEEVLGNEFGFSLHEVAELLDGESTDRATRLCQSILSGPIDVDKLDYLYRDSLHCGVPYGTNFDAQRLIGSLCIHPERCQLALTERGITAAEMLVFARYIMFSEVYWHHAVRSATAMLQRAIHELQAITDVAPSWSMDDEAFAAWIGTAAGALPIAPLVQGVLGRERRLYKRIAGLNVLDDEETFRLISRKPYPSLVRASRQLAAELAQRTGLHISDHEVLIDAPPVGLEIQFRIPVRQELPGKFRWLGDVSPVVQTLAGKQFDPYVKKVRVFAHPRIAAAMRRESLVHEILHSLAPGLPAEG